MRAGTPQKAPSGATVSLFGEPHPDRAQGAGFAGRQISSRYSAPAMEIILARVVVEDRGHSSPCWIWTGPVTHQGYGRTSVRGVGYRVRIHRVAYEAVKGPIPEGLVLDHLCRVRPCCNPDHLEPVTPAENTRRGVHVRTHCKYGHEYTPESTRISSKGSRFCGICYPASSTLRTKDRCRNGHTYGPDNPPGDRSTGHRCPICRRASHARHNVVKRLKRAAARSARREERQTDGGLVAQEAIARSHGEAC